MLVRHGETDWNRQRRVQGGASDVPLNETGRQQAVALAEWLRETSIQAVYSSPLERAQSTARIIAESQGIEVELVPDFIELDVGELEGVDVGSIGRRLDELMLEHGSSPAAATGTALFSKVQYIGGESLEDLQSRAWGALQRIVPEHSGGTIAVVSHYFVILSIVCAVIGLPLSRIGRFRLAGSSISTIVYDGEVPRLIRLGETGHLRGR
jgi:probable phosphoglycerate mutase